MANPILLYTPIFPEVAEAFTEKVFEHKEDTPIEVWVNGPGGSLSAGWSMLAALNDKGFNTTVTGDASSFYFYMLLFAEHNTAYDTSNFLVHRAASMWEDIMTDEELKGVADRNKIIRKKMEARIDEAKFTEVTGKTFDDIFSMDDRLDVSLTAQQAKKIGLVNKVIKLDVKKRDEIESKYFNDIAALSEDKTQTINSNINKNDMGFFSKDDPALLGAIGESQFVYSKLEVKAKIKVLGAGEHDQLSGTFEANNKKVTVINDEITAIEDIDNKQEQIEALTATVKELAASIKEITAEKAVEVNAELTDKSQEQITALASQVKELTETLAKAKLTASKPILPEGEFLDNAPADDLSVREKLAIEQNEMHEAKLKKQEE